MNNKLIIVVVLLIQGLVSGLMAQSTQPCIVVQYNQKSPKTPLSDVEVRVKGAGSGVSDDQGRLTLAFHTLKPGDRMEFISIEKQGFELLDSSSVAQWNISKEAIPFEIVLVQSAYLAGIKNELKQQSLNRYKIKYEQIIKELDSLKREGTLKEEEYNRRVEELKTNTEKQYSNLDNYIDQFARIDLSEVSKEEQRILDLVHEGKVDEAVIAYEELKVIENLEKESKDLEALNRATRRIEEEKQKKQETLKNLYKSIDHQISVLRLAGEILNMDKIKELRYRAAMADTLNLNAVYNYASFAEENSLYNDAEMFYKIGLRNSDDIKDRTLFQAKLGYLFLYGHFDYNQCEFYLQNALESFITLNETHEGSYLNQIARMHQLLGEVYIRTAQFDKAETHLLKAAALLRDVQGNRYHKESVYRTLAALYKKMKLFDKEEQNLLIEYELFHDLPRIPEQPHNEYLIEYHKRLGDMWSNKYLGGDNSIKHYKIAYELLVPLFDEAPNRYREQLAKMANNVGIELQKEGSFSLAEPFLRQAYDNFIVLFEHEPDKYHEDYIRVQVALGHNYRSQDRTEDMITLYSSALDSLQLYGDSEIKRKELARLQETLGEQYKRQKDYEKAERFFLQALDNRKKLFESRPQDDTSGLELGDIHYKLGMLYFDMGDEDKADQHFLLREVFRHNLPPLFFENVAEKHKRLGDLYRSLFLDQEARAVDHYLKAEAVYIDSIRQNAQIYRPKLAEVQSDIGKTLYMQSADYAKPEKYRMAAEKYLKKALDQYGLLLEQEPEKYMEDYAWTAYDLVSLSYADQSRVDMLYSILPNYLAVVKSLNVRDKGDFPWVSEQYRIGRFYCWACLAKEKYEEAALFSREVNPNEEFELLAEGYNLLAVSLAKDEEYEKAISAINQAIALKPNAANYYNTKGEICFKEGDLESAVDLCWQALKLDSSINNSIWTRTGLLEYSLFHELYIKRLIGVSPKDKVKEAIIEYKATSADLQKTMEIIDEAINAQPDDVELYYQKGQLLEDNGHEQEALEMWLIVQELAPGFLTEHAGPAFLSERLSRGGVLNNSEAYRKIKVDVQHTIGRIYLNLDNYDKAREYFIKSLDECGKLFAKSPDAYREEYALANEWVGAVYEWTKDDISAEPYYIKALDNYSILTNTDAEYQADQAWMQYSLMIIYSQDSLRREQYNNMLNLAWTNYESLFERDSSAYASAVVEMRLRKGWDFLQKGDTDAAIRMFEKAYALDPAHSSDYLCWAYGVKADEYKKAKRYKKAITFIDKAIAISDKAAEYYCAKGELLLLKGEKNSALEIWKKVQRMDPSLLEHKEDIVLYRELQKEGLIRSD